jgi:hypothetical protein
VPSEEKITTDALRALASKLDEVRTALDEAGESFEHAEIFGTSFSHYGLEMAAAYPGARDFAVRDAVSKARHVETIQERLRSTAATWDEAEGNNVVTLAK